ncbi:MAG: hypothetical protein NC078_00365 [Ruminococcus sp.]|nr:hypothetical protein [Ruminococcus sp.]
MENKKNPYIKAVAAAVIVFLFAAYSYGFFQCLPHMSGKDFRNVYGAACKNINILCNHIDEVRIEEGNPVVILKNNYFAFYLAFYDTDKMNFTAALNIYTELTGKYGYEEAYVSTGASGSSDCTFSINSGNFVFNYMTDPQDKINEMMVRLLKTEKINKIRLNYNFSIWGESLPENTSVEELDIWVYPNAPELGNFKNLRTLTLRVGSPFSPGYIPPEEERLNMDFLNELTELESLTVKSWGYLVNFEETCCGGVKYVKFDSNEGYMEDFESSVENSGEFKEALRRAFPNAQIEVVYD